MQEDSFCINVLDFFIQPFIGSIPNTSLNGNSYELPESQERKRKLAKMLASDEQYIKGRKPDRSVGISIDNDLYHVVLCEVKTAKTAKTAEKRGDLIKLGTMMKDCLDKILSSNFPRDLLFVIGIVQDGQSCTLFTMNSPCNYFYQMADVYSCVLPGSKDDLNLLFDTAILFSYARSLADTAISLLEQKEELPYDDDFDARLTCKSPKVHHLYYNES